MVFRYWSYEIRDAFHTVVETEGGFECESDAEFYAQARIRELGGKGLYIRTFQPSYNDEK